MTPEGSGSVLWGGRFESGPSAEMLGFTASWPRDLALLQEDLRSTVAHAHVLRAADLLDEAGLEDVLGACDRIRREVGEGIAPGTSYEDVHSFVEARLTGLLGDTGARIHAGRSRNDLVASDFRLWCRSSAAALHRDLSGCILTICDLAEEHVGSIMPGYTHLQRAQPVTLGFHLLAHGFAFARDLDRFQAARRSAEVSVLGAGALAGTTLRLDARRAADGLGLADVFDNAMDAVSDRDFAVELVFAIALCGVHMSRLAEEVVLWTSAEFGFARISDEWSTGSSMMPQKRNPDVAELIRGRAAPAIGDLTSLLVLLKGLPLAYNRDLQEDKDIVFPAVERMSGCIHALARMLPALTFDTAAMAAAAGRAGTWATDVAETLVGRGVPFREAHEIAGSLVAELEQRGLGLADAGSFLPEHDVRLRPDDAELADPARSVAARTSHGGPAPARVKEQIATLRARAEAGAPA